MTSIMNKLTLVLLASALALAGCKTKEGGKAAVEAKPVTWKMASTFAGTLPILGTGGVYFSDTLNKITSGRVDIKFFDPGKLVPALEVFDATSKGAIDAAWSAAGYWTGKVPSAVFFAAMPFGPDTTEYLAWIYHGGGWDLWKEIYAKSNIMPIPCGIIPPEASGWFRDPITKLEQFKGMKIRFYGIGGQAMQKLGASVQLLAGGDIYPALERGVLDATEFSMPSIDQKLGFNKISKHYYFPGWHQQASLMELIINMEKWKSLSEADQTLIKVVCRDTIVQEVTEGEHQQGAALSAFRADGVQIHVWPDNILKGFEKAFNEVVEEQRKADADFSKVYDSYTAYRKNYKEWAKLSRLPASYNP
ncbi:MAG: TRAP transporter substrate-binding protein [Deltaproteobacteria bacterium]|nr:TRAP transporter substrate-binding protein [Deltaproteobacteria bacterium]